MNLNKVISQLNTAGYNSQDIIDLVDLFLTQLAEFDINSDINRFSQQLHKLKGGLRLLYLEGHLLRVEKIEENIQINLENSTETLSLIQEIERDLIKIQQSF